MNENTTPTKVTTEFSLMNARQALSSVDKQRKFLDALAIELSIKKPSDWGNVTIQQVKEYGGNALFSSYGDSLLRTLKIVYSGLLN